eukprot:gene12701-8663_t
MLLFYVDIFILYGLISLSFLYLLCFYVVVLIYMRLDLTINDIYLYFIMATPIFSPFLLTLPHPSPTTLLFLSSSSSFSAFFLPAPALPERGGGMGAEEAGRNGGRAGKRFLIFYNSSNIFSSVCTIFFFCNYVNISFTFYCNGFYLFILLLIDIVFCFIVFYAFYYILHNLAYMFDYLMRWKDQYLFVFWVFDFWFCYFYCLIGWSSLILVMMSLCVFYNFDVKRYVAFSTICQISCLFFCYHMFYKATLFIVLGITLDFRFIKFLFVVVSLWLLL